MSGSDWTKEREAELVELHLSGMQGKEIADSMGIHRKAVSRRLRVLREAGLLTSPTSQAPAQRAVPEHIRRLKRAQRGFDVPPDLEDEYIALIKGGVSIADACRRLNISKSR